MDNTKIASELLKIAKSLSAAEIKEGDIFTNSEWIRLIDNSVHRLGQVKNDTHKNSKNIASALKGIIEDLKEALADVEHFASKSQEWNPKFNDKINVDRSKSNKEKGNGKKQLMDIGDFYK